VEYQVWYRQTSHSRPRLLGVYPTREAAADAAAEVRRHGAALAHVVEARSEVTA
jgi:hypothetical protein